MKSDKDITKIERVKFFLRHSVELWKQKVLRALQEAGAE